MMDLYVKELDFNIPTASDVIFVAHNERASNLCHISICVQFTLQNQPMVLQQH